MGEFSSLRQKLAWGVLRVEKHRQILGDITLILQNPRLLVVPMGAKQRAAPAYLNKRISPPTAAFHLCQTHM